MAFDLGNKISLGRLHQAKQTSRRALEPFCKSRTEMIRDYVGSWYSSGGARLLTYVNKINQTARIYTTLLAFNNPRVRVRSFNPELWPFCADFQANINRLLPSIDFKTTLRLGLLDSFFLMGVFNVRLADAGYKEFEPNVWIDPGKAWVDRISPDNLLLDMTAQDIRAVRFIGHRYRVSHEAVMDREDFDPKIKRLVTPTSKYDNSANAERASQIAAGMAVDDDELEPMVWLEDVYLPESRQLATFWVSGDETSRPLKVSERDDRALGPYKILSLGLVPDNVIPSSPAQNLKPLHDLANRLWRKLSRQADRQKSIVAYPPGEEADALRAKKAQDGEYVLFRNPQNLAPINFPGADGGNTALFQIASEVYNTMAGNERVLGGLGSQADTLGQERMAESHAAGIIGQMKSAVSDCVAEICREIGGLMFDDEVLTLRSWREAENTGRMVRAPWEPGRRKGSKEDYDFSVEPNSLTYRPPEVMVQETVGYLQGLTTVFPLIQAGIVDLQQLTRIVAEAQNNPELLKIVRGMDQWMIAQQGGDRHEATKPPVTSRETVRRNGASGPQGEGMSAVLGQMMQGQRMGPQRGVTVG